MKIQRSRRSRFLRLSRDARGVTAVEFAILAPVFVLFVMGLAEVGLMMGARGVLDNAVFVGARTGKTGYKDSGKSQQETILAAIQKAAASYIDPSKIKLKSAAYNDFGNIGKPEPFTDVNNNGKRDGAEPYTDVNGNGSYDSDQGKTGYGGSDEIVVYTATYDWRTFTPLLGKLLGTNGVISLKSSIVVKNEPFG